MVSPNILWGRHWYSMSTPIFFSFLVSGLLACNSKANRVKFGRLSQNEIKQDPKWLGGAQNHFQLDSCFGNMSQLLMSQRLYMVQYQLYHLIHFLFVFSDSHCIVDIYYEDPSTVRMMCMVHLILLSANHIFLARTTLQSINFFPFPMFSVTFWCVD